MQGFIQRTQSIEAADKSRAKERLSHWRQKLKETPGCPYAKRMIKKYSEQLENPVKSTTQSSFLMRASSI